MMKRLVVALAVLGSAAYAQAPQPVPPLSTQGVGIDRNGICWVQGPANEVRQVAPKPGTPVAITSATQILAPGVWLVVSGSNVTVVVSDGTAVTGVASGNAYPV